MSRYMNEAKFDVEKIEYYYKYGGHRGHSQAIGHFNRLGSLISRASRSKNNRNDAQSIQRMYNSVLPLMEEMKKRETAGPPHF
jgi:hypothetical protein